MIDPRAPQLLTKLERLSDEAIPAELEAIVRAGGGVWIDPEAEISANRRPSSHMFEISVYGISAMGGGKVDAARNWIRVARYATAPAAETSQ